MDKTYRVIGIMSGTSMDGVDLAYCHFTLQQDHWSYQIIAAETIPYNPTWVTRLTELPKQPALAYAKTDVFFGKYLGQLVQAFIAKNKLQVDLIASHGHTIFHQPQQGFTAQIGSGAAIHAETSLPVVCDFRSIDVMLGGQGAPLVPIGDALLFGEFDACLNLGGFSNISFNHQQQRVAFDVSPCNIVMNPMAQQLGLPFDDGGKLAASGEVHQELLQALNQLDYYKNTQAKSLGLEWVQQQFWPTVGNFQLPVEDLLATLNKHIAEQIAAVINQHQFSSVLVTGGGAYNQHLIKSIEQLTQTPLQIPDKLVIDFKEALIFAFLGVLNIRNEHNCLCSVTGALKDHVGGCLYGNVIV